MHCRPTVWNKKSKHNKKFYEDRGWDKNIPKKEVFDEILRVSKEQIIWGGNYFVQYLKSSMGWVFWDKGQHGLSQSDGELAYTSFNRALRVVEMNRCKIANCGGAIHPTQKPVALYVWLLENYAKPGQKIFDPFLGSGSSRIASYSLGFDFYGCELDKEYYRLQEERFQKVCNGIEKVGDREIQQLSLF